MSKLKKSQMNVGNSPTYTFGFTGWKSFTGNVTVAGQTIWTLDPEPEPDEFEKFSQWVESVRQEEYEAKKDKRGGIHKYVDQRYRKW